MTIKKDYQLRRNSDVCTNTISSDRASRCSEDEDKDEDVFSAEDVLAIVRFIKLYPGCFVGGEVKCN